MHRLIDELEAVEAPRIENAKKHKLGDILCIAIAAGVADADTWNQIEDYAIEGRQFEVRGNKIVGKNEKTSSMEYTSTGGNSL